MQTQVLIASMETHNLQSQPILLLRDKRIVPLRKSLVPGANLRCLEKICRAELCKLVDFLLGQETAEIVDLDIQSLDCSLYCCLCGFLILDMTALSTKDWQEIVAVPTVEVISRLVILLAQVAANDGVAFANVTFEFDLNPSVV